MEVDEYVIIDLPDLVPIDVDISYKKKFDTPPVEKNQDLTNSVLTDMITTVFDTFVSTCLRCYVHVG